MNEHGVVPVLRKISAGIMLWWTITPLMVQVLLVLMVTDTILGLVSGAVQGKLTGSFSLRKLVRKPVILIIVALFQWIPLTKLELGVDIGSAIVAFYSIQEIISILKHVQRLGVPLPEVLNKILTKPTQP